MYFPGDPLFVQDPIFNSVRDPSGPRERLIARFDHRRDRSPTGRSRYELDIVLRGRGGDAVRGGARR